MQLDGPSEAIDDVLHSRTTARIVFDISTTAASELQSAREIAAVSG